MCHILVFFPAYEAAEFYRIWKRQCIYYADEIGLQQFYYCSKDAKIVQVTDEDKGVTIRAMACRNGIMRFMYLFVILKNKRNKPEF